MRWAVLVTALALQGCGLISTTRCTLGYDEAGENVTFIECAEQYSVERPL